MIKKLFGLPVILSESYFKEKFAIVFGKGYVEVNNLETPKTWQIVEVWAEESEFFGLPVIKIWEDKNWIKHIKCNNSRDHVISYGITWDKKVIMRCNNKNCVVNAPDEVQMEAWEKCKDG